MLFFLHVHYSSVNDTIRDVLALNYPLICSEWNIVEAGDTRCIDSQLWRDVVPGVLFGVEFGGGLAVEPREGNQVARLAALGRLQQLSCVAVGGLCTQDHAVAHVVGQLSCLQVHQNYTQFVLHVLNGD